MIIIGLLFLINTMAAAPFDFGPLLEHVSLGEPDDIAEYLNEVERPIRLLVPQEYGELFQALAQEKIEKVQLLYDAGFLVVSGRDQAGNTLLHHAAIHGNTALAKWLIDRGADKNARNTNNEMPLDRVNKKKVAEFANILSSDQPLLDKIMADQAVFVAAMRGADINQGSPEATLLQIMLKKLFDSRFGETLTDEVRENLAKNIVTLIDSDASLDPKIAPKSITSSYQSPIFYAALSDGEIFEKMVEKKPSLLALELPNKNTILGQLVLEFLKNYTSNAEYLGMLADQIRAAVSKGASLRAQLHGIANFSGSIKELVVAQKSKYPRLYEIFFESVVENLELCAYSLEALRSAL